MKLIARAASFFWRKILRLKGYLKEKRLSKNFEIYAPGSQKWLESSELHFGGFVTKVKRNKVSPLDPRNAKEILHGGMTGGDRMLHHGYAKWYAQHLSRFLGVDRPQVILECGILKGTGLAVWSALFPKDLVIGIDIDLAYTKSNLTSLKKKGAFKNRDPILLEFDQFNPNTDKLNSILNGRKVSIAIDDGHHSIESIVKTLKALEPFLAENFVYFIEDNRLAHFEIRHIFKKYTIYSYDELTVVEEKKFIS